MSSPEIKNVILIGASGNLGPAILSTFLNHSQFNITVLSRNTSTSTFPSNVRVIRADYDSLDSLTSAFCGQDAVISFVGGAAIGDQTKLIDAAVAAGVKRFLPSEFGSDTQNDRLREIIPVLVGKKATLEYLRGKEGEGLSWTGVVPGPFFDWGLQVGFLGFDVKNKVATMIDEGKGRFSTSNLRYIGLGLIKILENPDLTKNQYICFSSFQTSQAELLPIVEKVTGEKFTVKNVTSEELIKEGNAKLQRHDYSGIPDLIQAGLLGKENMGDNRQRGLWNDKLGLEKEDLEESVRTALGVK